MSFLVAHKRNTVSSNCNIHYVKKGSGLRLAGSRGGGLSQEHIDSLMKTAKVASNVVFGDLGTNVSNALHQAYNKNPYWRPGFSGEKHLIIPTNYGPTRGNWIGPSTNIEARLNRGDKGVDGPNGIDIAAKKHDLLYSKAKNLEDVRKADNIFIQDVKQSSQGPKTKAIVVAGMKAKKIGEDAGLINPNLFAKLQDVKGTGKPIPATKLKEKLLRKIEKDKKKSKELTAQVRV